MLNLFGTLVVYALIAHQCGSHMLSAALYRTTEFTQKEERKQIKPICYCMLSIEQNTHNCQLIGQQLYKWSASHVMPPSPLSACEMRQS
jgi:hypothetical protein